MWRSGTFLLYSCKAAFWIQETSLTLSDVERSVILQSVFAIGSTLAYLLFFWACATPPHVQVRHTTWLSFTRPSPALVLQATNAGVRRPGYDAKDNLRSTNCALMKGHHHIPSERAFTPYYLWKSGTFPKKTASKWVRYWSQTWTVEWLSARHQTVLTKFLGFRKPLYSCIEGMCHSSTRPGTSLHVTQFYQAFPRVRQCACPGKIGRYPDSKIFVVINSFHSNTVYLECGLGGACLTFWISMNLHLSALNCKKFCSVGQRNHSELTFYWGGSRNTLMLSRCALLMNAHWISPSFTIVGGRCSIGS